MVTSARMRQDFEVNPEEREIDEKRQDDETKGTCEEVLQDMFLDRLLETFLFMEIYE